MERGHRARTSRTTAPAPAAPQLLPQHDPEARRRKSGPALRAFFRIAGVWELDGTQQRGLLGWPPSSTFHKWRSGSHGTLPYDVLVRVSLILGIFKALAILYPQERFADAWVRMPNTNPTFGGKPPIELMVSGGVDGLTRVRRLLDSRRGGWN